MIQLRDRSLLNDREKAVLVWIPPDRFHLASFKLHLRYYPHLIRSEFMCNHALHDALQFNNLDALEIIVKNYFDHNRTQENLYKAGCWLIEFWETMSLEVVEFCIRKRFPLIPVFKIGRNMNLPEQTLLGRAFANRNMIVVNMILEYWLRTCRDWKSGSIRLHSIDKIESILRLMDIRRTLVNFLKNVELSNSSFDDQQKSYLSSMGRVYYECSSLLADKIPYLQDCLWKLMECVEKYSISIVQDLITSLTRAWNIQSPYILLDRCQSRLSSVNSAFQINEEIFVYTYLEKYISRQKENFDTNLVKNIFFKSNEMIFTSKPLTEYRTLWIAMIKDVPLIKTMEIFNARPFDEHIKFPNVDNKLVSAFYLCSECETDYIEKSHFWFNYYHEYHDNIQSELIQILDNLIHKKHNYEKAYFYLQFIDINYHLLKDRDTLLFIIDRLRHNINLIENESIIISLIKTIHKQQFQDCWFKTNKHSFESIYNEMLIFKWFRITASLRSPIAALQKASTISLSAAASQSLWLSDSSGRTDIERPSYCNPQFSSYCVAYYGKTKFYKKLYLLLGRTKYGSLQRILFEDRNGLTPLLSSIPYPLGLYWMINLGAAIKELISYNHCNALTFSLDPTTILVDYNLRLKLSSPSRQQKEIKEMKEDIINDLYNLWQRILDKCDWTPNIAIQITARQEVETFLSLRRIDFDLKTLIKIFKNSYRIGGDGFKIKSIATLDKYYSMSPVDHYLGIGSNESNVIQESTDLALFAYSNEPVVDNAPTLNRNPDSLLDMINTTLNETTLPPSQEDSLSIVPPPLNDLILSIDSSMLSPSTLSSMHSGSTSISGRNSYHSQQDLNKVSSNSNDDHSNDAAWKDVSVIGLLFQFLTEAEFRLGRLYLRKATPITSTMTDEEVKSSNTWRSLAKQCFLTCLQKSYPYAHLGLASICSDPIQEIHHLILAGRDGVVGGWVRLHLKYEERLEYRELIDNTLDEIELSALTQYYNSQNWDIELLQASPTTSNVEMSSTLRSTISDLNLSISCNICRLNDNISEGFILYSSHIPSSEITIDKEIARGGYGAVSLGTWCDSITNQSNLIVLKRSINDVMCNIHSLRDEMILMRLFHNSQYIVRCYGHTMMKHPPFSQAQLYLIMEYSQYGDLTNVIKKLQSTPSNVRNNHSPFIVPLWLLIRWMRDIAYGIQEMHKRLVRHGDIKPANVLLFPGCDCDSNPEEILTTCLHVKLTDFGGSSKDTKYNLHVVNVDNGEIESTDDSDRLSDVSLSNETLTLTPGYIPPEYLQRRRTIGNASDIFSFGMTCVHLLNGKTPSSSEWGMSLTEAMDKLSTILDGDYKQAMVALKLKELIKKCCDINILNRPYIDECVQELEHLSSEKYWDMKIMVQNLMDVASMINSAMLG